MVSPAILLITLATIVLLYLANQLFRQARSDRAARVESERQLRYSDQLQQLTATLSRARTLNDVIHACLPELLHITNAAAGAVTLISDDGRMCEVAHAVGYEAAVLDRGRSRATTSRSVIADAIRLRELVVVESRESRAPDSHPRASDDLLATHQGSIVVPLMASGRALGAVAMS